MLRQYAGAGNATNTASSTLPLANLIGTAAIMPEITEFTIGSDAVASNAAKYALQRGTTIGGGWGSAITPAAQGPVTTAALTTMNSGGAATGPTLTANTILYQVGLNQQATYRWLANPGSGIFVLQAAAACVNLLSLVAAVAFNAVYTFVWSE
jgi:hypothetical protein